LLAALERRLAENMVESPIIAVGITTSAKAVARVLRRVALMPNGHVILPGVDLALSDERWDDLSAATDDAQGFGRRRNVEVHPQFHLKHLLLYYWDYLNCLSHLKQYWHCLYSKQKYLNQSM
jgi:ATP-dependent helicase/nuclease subunit B